MSRKGPAPKRKIALDPKYNNLLVAKLISQVLKDGKRAVAERLVYDSFDMIQQKSGSQPLDIMQKAIDNVKPHLEVKPRRVGGATYQVPVEVHSKRGLTLALRWIVNFARERSGRPMAERLAQELLDAASGQGSSVKKREDLHKMADANRAFAHYRW